MFCDHRVLTEESHTDFAALLFLIHIVKIVETDKKMQEKQRHGNKSWNPIVLMLY